MLKRFPGMTDDPIVIKNLRYWGAPRQRRVRADAERGRGLRAWASNAFEFKGTNGFMITFDITSSDVKQASAK